MTEVFISTFLSTFMSMLKIFFIILLAGLLIRKKVVTQQHLAGLSTATVDVFLPCMIFTNILNSLRPDEFQIWWVLPLCAVFMTFLGLLLGAVFFAKELPAKMNMLSLASIQNSGYLVLPIGAVLFKDQFDLFSVYVFLFILGQSPLMWSVGKYMATAVPGKQQNWKGLITTPMMATLLALAVVFSGFRDTIMRNDVTGMIHVVAVLLDALKLLGEATVPVALFVLGGILGGIRFKISPYLMDTFRVVIIKLFLIPCITLLILYSVGLGKTNDLLAMVLIIQSAAAPAVAIMLQLKRYGGDEQKMGSILLICYCVCLVSLPIWMAFWKWISVR